MSLKQGFNIPSKWAVLVLAMANPIALDLVLPIGETFLHRMPSLKLESIVTGFLVGLALGQLVASLLTRLWSATSVSLLAGLLYCLSSTATLWTDSADLFIASRMAMGIASGVFYLHCLQLIVSEQDSVNRANLYSHRSTAILYASFFLPLASAGVASQFSYVGVVAIQLIYGLLCCAIASVDSQAEPSSNQREISANGVWGTIGSIAMMVLTSMLLYCCLASIPRAFAAGAEGSSYKVAGLLMACALTYHAGVAVRKNQSGRTTVLALSASILVYITLIVIASIFGTYEIVNQFGTPIIYFIGGVVQGVFASRAYSAAIFQNRTATALLSCLTLAASACAIFLFAKLQYGLFSYLILAAVVVVMSFRYVQNIYPTFKDMRSSAY